MTEHLTELALELIRTGEAAKEERDHLEGCATCRARLSLFTDLASLFAASAVSLAEGEDFAAVPAKRDADMMAIVDAEAKRIRSEVLRKKSHRKRIVFGIAAASAVAAAVSLFWVFPKPAKETRSLTQNAIAAAGSDDINRDGYVDILDAFALSRQLEQTGKISAYDTAEVNRIAALAVSLKKGSR